MRRFWRLLLQRTLPPDSLAGVHVAVFGLGDSTYAKFNYAAKKLSKRLAQLGAARAVYLGLADDVHALGVDGALDPWLAALWPACLSLGVIARANAQESTSADPPRFSVSVVQQGGSDNGFSNVLAADRPWLGLLLTLRFAHLTPTAVEMTDPSTPFKLAAVANNERITAADHFQDVRHIALTLPHDPPTFHPGDVVDVLPQNRPEDVLLLCDWLGVDPHTIIRVAQSSDGLESAVPACLTGKELPVCNALSAVMIVLT